MHVTEINTPEEIQLDTNGWTPEVVASAGLGLLLSIHLGTPESLFHLCATATTTSTTTLGHRWDFRVAVDAECSAYAFLERVGQSYLHGTALPSSLQTFWLRTDSFESWEVSNDTTSSSYPTFTIIPRQILCTVTESQSQASRSLGLSIPGDASSANTRFLHQLAHVCRQSLAAARSCGTLRDLDLICDVDRRDIQRWNKQPPTTVASTVHDKFRQRVLEGPHSPAIESWDGALTYLELDGLSSRVSSLLVREGARPGDIIPICFEKSLWTLVSMLGVMKIGCAFLLMDVSHPTSRLRTLCTETKATIILCSETQHERAVRLSPGRAFFVSASSLSPFSAGDQQQQQQEDKNVSPSDVAAVIFTSGTTGIPKAIQLEHKSICSSLLALAEICGIGRHTRYFQFSSYAFDLAFGEILMTLMQGGCVCIPSEADRLDNMAASTCGFDANTISLTPTVVRLLSPSDVPCLRTLISGGEKVTKDIAALWADKLDLVIVYGPAETTVACVAKRVSPATVCDGDESVRIGFPMNGRSWVARLDDPNRLAPVGAVGELVSEGPGTARGYLNNESGNKDLFHDSLPWATEWESEVPSMGRIYRTGDLVRYDDKGELIFIGRRDRQVKLRGQRIELEDIEIKLKQNFRVPGALIMVEVISDAAGTANLVAFLHHPSVCDTTTTTLPVKMKMEIQELSARISEVLPAYMWPVAWIPLKKLPLGPTGKLDRRELLRLGNDFYSNMSTIAVEDKENDDPGLSPMELELARIWRKLLPPGQSIASDANFFQLGGDSLRCMKLMAIANQQGFHLTMDKIFRNSTLSAMTAAMQKLPPPVAPAVNGHESHLDAAVSLPGKQLSDTSEFHSLLEEYGLSYQHVSAVFPCTSLQAGLFSLSQAMPYLYSSQFVFDFSSAVDVQKFKTAWESAVAVFPILKTVIIPSAPWGLVQAVLHHHDEWTEVRQDLASFLASDKATGSFQPGRLLSRHYHILDPSSGSSHFVWILHHAVYDGWSLGAVVDFVRQAYDNSSLGEIAQPMAGSFRDFVQFCEGLNRDECVSFWTDQLRNAPTPSFPSFPKAGHLAADRSCLRYTMAAAPAVGTTVTTTITVLARASWALLLSEYEGSDDVTFGNSLHGRNSLPPDLQDVVGPTITTLPIRVRIDPGQTIVDFLEGLQEQFSAMIPYEQFGLSQIMGIDQTIHNAASFRTLLIVQVADEAKLLGKEPKEQGIRLREVERSLHEYPLVLTLEPGDSQIEIIATFDSDVIPPAQVQRILRQFEQTFHELCSAPRDSTVGDLDLASEADKSTLFGWNARHHKAYEVRVDELIRERTRHCNASPAIYSREGTMDYGTLDVLSDNLAGEMVRSGVRPGETVGVLFEKSQWAIVSTVATIKAGASFAPFSPQYPRARLECIAKDAGIKVVLCSPLQEEAFPNPPWSSIVVSDSTVHSLPPATHLPTAKLATPESLLYVLSTSGTTGVPKIFGVQHKSFVTGAIARAPLLRRGLDSRVLQFAPYAFDPSVDDILTTLMFGGCICSPSEDDVLGDMTAFMKTARVNFANITPSVAHTLRPHELPDLAVLLLSGEAPSQALVDKWDTGTVRLMNGYGPSECSVKCAINCSLSRDEPRNVGHSAGTSLWVVKLGNHDRITPLGAVGELIIESPHLATGYMNRPEANADKFIAAPAWLRNFRDGHLTRAYKTGDLVRYAEDGSIVFIGRGDMQLKLHGQRLEAEEVQQRIQQSLSSDQQVQVLVDIARFEGQDEDVLVAYMARNSSDHHLRGRYEMEMDNVLQQYLVEVKDHIVRQIGATMPKYMIPSVFLAVMAIPVTGNGKADRRALKAYAASQRLGPHLLLTSFSVSSGAAGVRPPSSDMEKLLHGLWQNTLGWDGEQFGTDSHFFELGGGSLSAIRLASAARDLGYSLPAYVIFKNPVLSAMAAQMAPLKEKTKGPSRFGLLGRINRTAIQLKKSLGAYGIDEADVEDAYPLTRQQRLYMEGEMLSPGGTTYRHMMRLPANIDLARLETALRRVVHANALLRTRVIPVMSQLVQVVLKEEEVPCRHFNDLSSLSRADKNASWGLGHRLSRFSIVDSSSPQEGRWLVWSTAHVIFDGWCRRLLLEDIDLAYCRDDSPPERPRYDSFIEYVYGLEQDEIGAALVRELDNTVFWSYFTLDGRKAPGITHTVSLAVEFPVATALPTQTSYATVMLTAWAVAAAHNEGYDKHFLFKVLLGGRDAEFTGIDRLTGPASTTSPLPTFIERGATFQDNVEVMQKRIGEAGRVQHLVQLGGDQLQGLLASAPTVVVHPGDEYDEAATEHLALVRNRVETVRPLVDAMFMNFCLRPGNVGVDLVMTIDESFFPVDNAVRYLGCVERVLAQVLVPGGMDSVVEVMDLVTGANLGGVSVDEWS